VSIILYLILVAITGLIVGALGRLAIPGRDPMTIWQTILVGIGGSLIGGLAVWLITGGRSWGGFLASVLGAALIVYLIRRSRGGTLTTPGRSP
jgi:uncharacterized membrane protein YeaQ/YmgE (transglycosylase-associated protein family)